MAATENQTNGQQPPALRNGEVVEGDPEYDGRVILYVIKGTATIHPSVSHMVAAR